MGVVAEEWDVRSKRKLDNWIAAIYPSVNIQPLMKTPK
jgi:hypothetical protein